MFLRRERDVSGAAAVETALCLCFLVLPLTFAIIAYGYMLGFRQSLSQATAEGARAAVGAPSAALMGASAETAVSSALAQYQISCRNNVLWRHDVAVPGSACVISSPTTAGCATGRTCVQVKVLYPYRSHSLLPTIPGLGFTLPPDLSFTSVVQVS